MIKWLTINYLDKAIVEEETKGRRDCNKCLLKLLSYGVSNDAFHIGTGCGVVVFTELRRSRIWKKTKTQWEWPDKYETKRTHLQFLRWE